MRNLSIVSALACVALLSAGCAVWQGTQDAVSSVAGTEPIKTIVDIPKNVAKSMTAKETPPPVTAPLKPVEGSIKTAQKPLEEVVETAKPAAVETSEKVVETVKAETQTGQSLGADAILHNTPTVQPKQESAPEPVQPVVEAQQTVVEPSEPAVSEGPAKTVPAVETRSAALLVADFNTGEKPTNLGGDFGSWNKDPNDKTQFCNMTFDPKVRWGNAGYSVRLDYKVESPNPAYNGFWMKLNDCDASKYTHLVFYVKGDPEKKFTSRFKVELKNKSEVGAYMVNGVTGEWQKITIPLNAFNGLSNKSALTEFVIVFDDLNSTQKTGSVNIDDIYFE